MDLSGPVRDEVVARELGVLEIETDRL